MKRTTFFRFCRDPEICFIAILSLVLLCLSGCHTKHADQTVTFTLLHTNDTHSQLESYIPFGEPEQAGVARRKALIDKVRNDVGAENVLLVDAGDFSQGTIYYNVWHGAADVMALNQLGYDAATLGNHDVDLGAEQLQYTLSGGDEWIADRPYETSALKIPLVMCNLDFSAIPLLQQRIKRSIVVEKGGAQIGIVGVMTETVAAISGLGDEFPVSAYLPSVQAEIDLLKTQGINKIVLLSHAGYGVDQQMASQLSGVDVIVSGHDHPLLLPSESYEADAPFEFLAAQVKGDYPTVTADAEGDPLLIVGAFERGRVLGRLDLTFDEGGLIENWQGLPILVDDQIAADSELTEKLAYYTQPLEAYGAVEIGRTGVYFDGSQNPGLRTQEMKLGNLVADATYKSALSNGVVDGAIVNGGGIRASIPEGVDPLFDQFPYPVSFRQAMQVLPFGNTISLIDLTGAELLAALDNGLSWAYDAETGSARSSGGFPQISGLTLTYCAHRANDMRAELNVLSGCSDALIDGGVVTALLVNGNPVDLNAIYRIATNTFLVGGGDYYASFEQACKREGNYCVDTGILLLDAFVHEFQCNATVVRGLEERIVAE